jgi:hypothetical protein
LRDAVTNDGIALTPSTRSERHARRAKRRTAREPVIHQYNDASRERRQRRTLAIAPDPLRELVAFSHEDRAHDRARNADERVLAVQHRRKAPRGDRPKRHFIDTKYAKLSSDKHLERRRQRTRDGRRHRHAATRHPQYDHVIDR